MNDDIPERIGNYQITSQREIFNPLTGNRDDDYQWRIREMIEDARSYNDDYRARRREVCMEFYAGLQPGLDQEGRSTIVATEARDTILSIMPSLMRIFTARENVCEYTPNYEAMVPFAEQATDYARTVVMEDNEGFLLLHNWFKDALTKGEGIVKWHTDDNKEVSYATFRGVTHDDIAFFLSQSPMASVEALHPSNADPIAQGAQQDAVAPADATAAPPGDPGPGIPSTGAPPIGDFSGGQGGPSAGAAPPDPQYDVTFKFTKSRPSHVVEGVPPDEFRVDRYAKSIREAVLVGSESILTPSQLIKKGYTQDVVDEFRGQDVVSVRWNMERSLRNPALDQGLGTPGVYDGINYGEYFIRVDKDGDGIDELRHICVMGNADHIVHDVPVDEAKYAFLSPDPEPHTLIGHSITELVEDLQRIKTNLMRNSLDSIASTIYPRIKFVESLVNIDDVLNDELGAPIRTKDISAVDQLATQFIGDAPMNMITYLDMVRTQRTGISDASKGLDPKALQSTASQGVDMVISGAQERIELVARIFAETGVKDLFKGILQEITRSPNPNRMMKVRGEFVSVRPDMYDPSMPVRVNPALGRSSDSDRMQILLGVKQTQEQIMTTQGVVNPLVTPVQYRNTLDDLLSLGGMKDVSRYFLAVNQQQLDAIANAPKPPQPMELQMQIDQDKLRAATTKHIDDSNFRQAKMDADEHFRRDKMLTDALTTIAAAQIKAGHETNLATLDAQLKVDSRQSTEQMHADKLASQERIAGERAEAQRQSAASRAATSGPSGSGSS